MLGNFTYLSLVEPRVKLYSLREESFPNSLKYIDVSRITNTNLDVIQQRRIDDYWNIDGSRDLSDYWTHTVYCIRREFARRMYVVREKTDKTTGNIQTRLFLTRTLNEIGKKCLVKGEAKMVKWKSKFDNARRLRGNYFIDYEDKEFKETIKKKKKKIGSTKGSSHTLQDMQEKQAWRNPK